LSSTDQSVHQSVSRRQACILHEWVRATPFGTFEGQADKRALQGSNKKTQTTCNTGYFHWDLQYLWPYTTLVVQETATSHSPVDYLALAKEARHLITVMPCRMLRTCKDCLG
jgi:hypothetical protein